MEPPHSITKATAPDKFGVIPQLRSMTTACMTRLIPLLGGMKEPTTSEATPTLPAERSWAQVTPKEAPSRPTSTTRASVKASVRVGRTHTHHTNTSATRCRKQVTLTSASTLPTFWFGLIISPPAIFKARCISNSPRWTSSAPACYNFSNHTIHKHHDTTNTSHSPAPNHPPPSARQRARAGSCAEANRVHGTRHHHGRQREAEARNRPHRVLPLHAHSVGRRSLRRGRRLHAVGRGSPSPRTARQGHQGGSGSPVRAACAPIISCSRPPNSYRGLGGGVGSCD